MGVDNSTLKNNTIVNPIRCQELAKSFRGPEQPAPPPGGEGGRGMELVAGKRKGAGETPTRQYSEGKRSVVALLSASVMIQSLVPSESL